MPVSISVASLDGNSVAINLKSPPDQCPRCHHNVQAVFRIAYTTVVFPTSEWIVAQAIYHCPRLPCQQLFVATYQNKNTSHLPHLGHAAGKEFELVKTEPQTPVPPTLPPEVADISPRFARIYAQAHAAESMGYDEVAGPGFGKALEVLVKDYLIRANPDAADAIKREFLGASIKRIDDARVQACAKRAAWLRNDESHYERRWDDRELSDLKLLITLTVNWIHNTLLTENYLKTMPEPG